MNAALYQAELQECHFVAALYAVYNERTQVVRWARGGSSYPILVPWRSEPRVLRSAGPLVGIGPKASFEVGEVRLRPGDSLFLYTDGMECLPPPSAVTSRGENVTSVDWLERARGGNLRTAMMHLESRIKSGSSTRTRDDITVIALQSHRPVSAPASLMRPAPVEARCEAAYS
jgi:sigma-B regulation protein RsbU (phosphoserine phosphatase)